MSSLAGKTILLTRTAESNASVARLFEQRGAKTLSLPTIEIRDPDSWAECDRAVSELDSYDGVFFTSRSAVEKFLGRIKSTNPGGKSVLAQRLLYAVGEKTEAALEEAGLPVALAPEIYSAEDLAKALTPDELSKKRFLFPKSSIARDVLPNILRSFGAEVEEVVVYKNVPPERGALDAVRNALLHEEVDVVSFFSPSAARNFCQMMGTKSLEHSVVAVIGPTVESAAKSLGMKVDIVAKQSTAESLVETLEEFFALNS